MNKQHKAGEGYSYNWLAALSVVCFVLAGVYIIKLAIDAGWLTPLRQCGLAALFGAALVGSGLRLREMDKSYSSYLSATGVVVLFMSVVAAGGYYHLISTTFALLLFALVALLSVWLFSLFRSPIYLVVAALGTYLAPFLLGARYDMNLVNGYYLVSSALFAFSSAFLGERLIVLVAAYLSFGAVAQLNFGYEDPLYVAGILALHFVLYLSGVVLQSFSSREALMHREACAFLPLILFFYALEYSLLQKVYGDNVNYLALGFVLLLNLLSFAAQKQLRKPKHLASYDVVLATSALVLYHAFYTQILDVNYQPLVMIAAILAAAVFPVRQRFLLLPMSQFIGGILLFLIIVSNSLLLVMKNFLDHGGNEWVVYGLLTTAALIFYYSKTKRTTLRMNDLAALTLFLAHIQGMLTLFRVTHEINSFAVSVAWAGYALLVLSVGYARREKIFAQSSVIILMISAAKVLLHDVSQTGAGVRIFCLLLTGVVLYVSGLALRKVSSWPEKVAA